MPLRDPAFAARLEAFQRFKIKHPYLEAMDQLLSDAIAEHTSYICELRLVNDPKSEQLLPKRTSFCPEE